MTGVDANPEAHEHARLKYTRPGVRFVRDLVESYSEPCDAVVFLQTIEHVQDPEAVLRHFREMLRPGGTAYVSTPNVLTLAPPGAEKSDNPWHLKEYRAEEFRALCESVFGDVELLGLFHARVLRAHELALRAGWDRVHAALGITKPFYDRFTPAISARDFALRPRAARPRARLRRGAPALTRRPQEGALALVLHSHMPYVEGFGTWPFGEEWLWEAVACVYLPLLDVLDGAPVTLGLTPVLCDQLEAMRGDAGDRYLRFLRDIRAPIHAEDAAGLDDTGEPALAAEVRRAAADYTRAERAFEERGRDLLGAFAALERRRALDLRRHPRAAAADGHRRRRAPPGGHRHRGAPAPLRRLGRRLLAARVRLRARARARAGRPRRARLLRRPDRAVDGLRPPHAGRHRGRPGRRCRSTGRRSSSSGATSTATPRTAPTATTGAARSTT